VASIIKLAMNDAGGFDADAVWGQSDDRPLHAGPDQLAPKWSMPMALGRGIQQVFGRSDDEWDSLLDNAIAVLKREAERRRMRSYSECIKPVNRHSTSRPNVTAPQWESFWVRW
jgi:hypothetical protein